MTIQHEEDELHQAIRVARLHKQTVIPSAVVDLRRATRLTQTEFGLRCGVGLAAVQRWEAGTVRPAASALVALRDIAMELGMTGLANTFAFGDGAAIVNLSASVLAELPKVDEILRHAVAHITGVIVDESGSLSAKQNELLVETIKMLFSGSSLLKRLMDTASPEDVPLPGEPTARAKPTTPPSGQATPRKLSGKSKKRS